MLNRKFGTSKSPTFHILNVASNLNKTTLRLKKDKKKKKSIKENELNILLNEYNLCNERIGSFIKRQDSLLQISMAIIGGALAFSLINKIADELFLVIPFIPIVLFTHILYHYTIVIANQGYRNYLQNRLNEYLDLENQIKYTSVAREFLLNKNPMSKVNMFLFPSIITLSVIYSLFMSDWNIIVVVGNIFNLIIVTVIIISFIKFTNKLDEKVQKYCE
jgi:hypothetical protein